MSTSALHVGDRVTLHGLVDAAHLNGRCGVLVGPAEAAGRWVVKIDSSSEQKAIKDTNLVRAAALAPDGADAPAADAISADEQDSEEIDEQPRSHDVTCAADVEPPPRAPADEPATSADEQEEMDTLLALPKSELQPGAWVVLHGLAHAELNGAMAVLIQPAVGSGGEPRWQSLLLPQAETKSLKPVNLEVVAVHSWAGRPDAQAQRVRSAGMKSAASRVPPLASPAN